MAVGAIGYLAVDEFGKARDALRFAKMIPKNHLLADTLIVPPGLFTDRWVIANGRPIIASGSPFPNRNSAILPDLIIPVFP